MVTGSKKIDKVIHDFTIEVNKQLPDAKIVIFGSYARGEQRPDSDIDIAVFSDSFNGWKTVDSITFLFRIANQFNDACIEPIGFGTDDLRSGNPFVMEILSQGQELQVS